MYSAAQRALLCGRTDRARQHRRGHQHSSELCSLRGQRRGRGAEENRGGTLRDGRTVCQGRSEVAQRSPAAPWFAAQRGAGLGTPRVGERGLRTAEPGSGHQPLFSGDGAGTRSRRLRRVAAAGNRAQPAIKNGNRGARAGVCRGGAEGAPGGCGADQCSQTDAANDHGAALGAFQSLQSA